MSRRQVGRRFVSSTSVPGRNAALGRIAHLHDELNGSDEVSQELEDEVLLLFFHLVEAILPAPDEHLLACETGARVRLYWIAPLERAMATNWKIRLTLVFRNDASRTRSRLLFFLLLSGC